jgi:hypothetical protein
MEDWPSGTRAGTTSLVGWYKLVSATDLSIVSGQDKELLHACNNYWRGWYNKYRRVVTTTVLRVVTTVLGQLGFAG